MIATPFRSARTGSAQPGALIPFSPGQTPGTSKQGQSFTPMATPLRDKLAINPEEALDNFETVQGSKQQTKQLKENLRKAFSELPAPQYQYDIVVEDVKPEDEQNDTEGGDIEMIDQSEVDSKRLAAKRAKIIREEKWSQAVQRGLPRPTNVRKTLLASATGGVSASLLAQADEMIRGEMLKILHFDALVNPTDEQTTFAGIESKNPNAKTYETLLANYLEEHPLEQVSEKDLASAKAVLNKEMKKVREGMEHEKLPLPDYTKVWDECYSQLIYLPAHNRYTKADMVSKRELIDAVASRLDQNRVEMSKEAKKASKIEKKLSILLGGYQTRMSDFLKQYRENANQIEQSRHELTSFQALKVREDNAIVKRIGALEEDVRRQNEREKSLQLRYDQLARRREELIEKLNNVAKDSTQEAASTNPNGEV